MLTLSETIKIAATVNKILYEASVTPKFYPEYERTFTLVMEFALGGAHNEKAIEEYMDELLMLHSFS